MQMCLNTYSRRINLASNVFLNGYACNKNIRNGIIPKNIIPSRNAIDCLPRADYNDLKREFSQHIQLHVTEKMNSTIARCTIGSIIFYPRFTHDVCNYLSYESGSNIDRRVAVILLVIFEVIT